MNSFCLCKCFKSTRSIGKSEWKYSKKWDLSLFTWCDFNVKWTETSRDMRKNCIISEHFNGIFISYRLFDGTEKSLPLLNYGPLTFQFVCVISFLLFRCLRHSINLESNFFPLYLNLKKKVPHQLLGTNFPSATKYAVWKRFN